MGKRYKRFRPPFWLLRLRLILIQVLLPLLCFQFIRTLLLPTTFDVILLASFAILYFLFLFNVI
ncbi:hypothetical protein BTR23_05875 [Alkalihalophilus pseudofirmus]|nr:hypothetical protein [Alkalihalobacterium alkalinitrilicum]OLO40517.1 hypothetical protein BTR23_05875 [Alkalihalophilus pseudofirmus]